MSKHTPGPWHIQDDHGKRWIEAGGNDDTIAEIHRRTNKGSVYSCKEADANANLIAAAPDLLEALEGMLDRYTGLVNCGDCGSWDPESEVEVITARKAIARAKGQSK